MDRRIAQKANWNTAIKYMSYLKLLMACRHMDDTTEIDKRILYLTANFAHGYPEYLVKPLYQKICLGLTGKAYPKGSAQPGLVIHEDTAGSRFNGVNDLNRHVHCLIILPHQVHGQDDLTKIASSLERRLNTDLKLNEMQDAKVIAYNTDDRTEKRSLPYLDGYNAKLTNKLHGEAYGRNLVSAVFPAELDQDNRKMTQAKLEFLDQQYELLLVRLHWRATTLFSDAYLQDYGEELLELIMQFRCGRGCIMSKTAA